MGHWSINNDETEEMWGDEESDILSDYFDYLAVNDPERLKNRKQLIEDSRVLVWNVYYELEVEWVVTDAELEYGINFCFSQEDEYPIENVDFEEHEEPLNSPIGYVDIEEHIGFDTEWSTIAGYLSYLQEIDPERLEDRERLLEETRLLTYEFFDKLRHRPARKEELELILDSSLSHI